MKRTHYKAQTNKGRDNAVERECYKLAAQQAAARRKKVR